MGRTLPILLQPPQRAARPVFRERFADGSGFAFNLEQPSGVKYLTRRTYDLFDELIQRHGDPPVIPDHGSTNATAELVRHGLASSAASGFSGSPSRARIPTMTVWFHISNACNLSCSYCYIPNLTKAVRPDGLEEHLMPWHTAETAIRKLFGFCESEGFRRLQIKFAGGEPTLNPDVIVRSCELAETLGATTGIDPSFRILTNGVFDAEKLVPIFRRYRVGVSISVDGDPIAHNETRFTVLARQSRNPVFPLIPIDQTHGRTRQGSWSRIESNVDQLLANGLKPYLLCTLTESNYQRIHSMIRFCFDRRIGFRLSPIRDKHSHAREGLQADMVESLSATYRWIGENYPASMPIERFARFAEWNLRAPKELACGTCRSMMAIDQRGTIASCQMRMDTAFGDSTIGDIADAFRDIRASADNTFLVSPHRKTGSCVTCDWRFVCAGGCPEHTRSVSGTPNTPSPWCALYMDLLPAYVRAVATQLKKGVDGRVLG